PARPPGAPWGREHRGRRPLPMPSWLPWLPIPGARSFTLEWSRRRDSMASYLGIDVGTSGVRVVVLRSSYRRLAIEAMVEMDRSSAPTLAEVIRAAAGPFSSAGESVAVSLEGERTFVRRVTIPETAERQLLEVLPFE